MQNKLKIDVLRTQSDEFYGESVSCRDFIDILKSFSYQAYRIGQLRNKLFANIEPEEDDFNYHGKNGCNFIVDKAEQGRQDTINILQGILGICAESGELVENILLTVTKGEKLYDLDLIDESGDILRYMQMMLLGIQSNIETVEAISIAKIAVRFPNGYSLEALKSRNTQLERLAIYNKYMELKEKQTSKETE